MARKGKDLNMEDQTRKEKKMQNDNERETERVKKKQNLKTPAYQLLSALRKHIAPIGGL